MAIFNSIISWIMKQRIHQMELFMKYPSEVQEEWRRNLINTAKDTEWGKKFDYKSIRTYEDFTNRVPVQDYDSIKGYISRLREGEQNILWPTEIKWFAKSSGTTSDKSKFIPVSNEALLECHFKGGKDLLSLYCNNNPGTRVFDGKGLILGGSHNISSYNNESLYGDLSAILIQNLPFWAHMIRTPDLSIALLDNWEEKIEKMARATIGENVTNISGVPTWTIVLGKKLLEMSGKKDLKEIWPNLELFVHGAVSFVPYVEQFQKLIPFEGMNYLETYNASEGFFGIQNDLKSDDMLLMLDYGVFYEFIPMEEFGNEHPRTLQIGEVETDRNYAVLISTNAGLWRYMIGDTIRFTSLKPYKFRITGRTRHYINAFGEELIIDNAEEALRKACNETGAIIREYTAGPIYFSDKGKGAHEWLIEFEHAPNDLPDFVRKLDEALQAVNSDYEAKRKGNMALTEPVVKIMPDNTFYNWLKAKGKLGGQHKVPRLANDRKFVEEILELNTI